MKYYQCNNKLIQHNDTTGVYRVRNTINKTDNILSKEQFDFLQPVRIKKSKSAKGAWKAAMRNLEN